MKAFSVILFISATCMFSCQDDQHKTNNEPLELRAGISELAETEWVLVGYKNSTLAAEHKNRVTIKFPSEAVDSSYTITGRGFINSYFGTYSIDQSTGLLSTTNGVSATKVGGSNEDMKAENQYFDHLRALTAFNRTATGLELHFASGEVGYFVRKE